MQLYRIEGNHPIGRYITWAADGLDDLNKKVKELEDHGYEVTVTSKATEDRSNYTVSISISPDVWDGVKEAARRQGKTEIKYLEDLITVGFKVSQYDYQKGER